MAITCLYKGTLFPYWLHHGIPRRRCLTARRQTKGRRTSDSSQRYWCSFGEIALNHLPATSHMHIRSLGLTSSWELAFYAPSSLRPGASWSFSFTHPKSLYVIVSIYFHLFTPFKCEFLWFVVCSHMSKLITNWANLIAYFQFLIQSLVRLCTVVSIFIVVCHS